jgi:hypothetical protein
MILMIRINVYNNNNENIMIMADMCVIGILLRMYDIE